MKECIRCHKKYTDDFDYCSICGGKLKPIHLNYDFIKHTCIIVSCFIVLVCGVGYTIHENNKFNNIKQEMQTDQANNLINDLASKPLTSDLEIESGWTWKVDGNYSYIDGSVKNTSSDKTINYFEVGANYLDASGNIIDSDYTNDGQPLLPNESRKFEIMHKYDGSYNKVLLHIQEVS
ncbi:MAG TPA: hypothetical protein DC024_10210 [Clostridiales bacterium]|nr:hypothetical protein [Clostridiales bacterium]